MNETPFKILRRPAQPEPEKKEEVEPPPVQTKTLEEKEAHYASVRRRIMGEDYNPNVNISEEDSGEKSTDNKQPEKMSPPVASPTAAHANRSPPNKPAAVPLMSIPTPALAYNKSFEGSKEILDLMMSSRQNQMPLLGAPQSNLVGGGNSNFISNAPVRGRHSDTALPHNFTSAPKMYGVSSSDLYGTFPSIPTPNPQLSTRQSLPSMSQPLDPSAFQMAQQYQNWGMMYSQSSVSPFASPTPTQQQAQQPFMQGGYDASGLNLPPRYQHYPPSSGQPPPYYHPSIPTTTTR